MDCDINNFWLIRPVTRAAMATATVLDTTPEGFLRVTMPLPRPGHIAEREELDMALAKKTREALLLFIDRHPDSRYRPEAEAALKLLTSPSNKN